MTIYGAINDNKVHILTNLDLIYPAEVTNFSWSYQHLEGKTESPIDL